MKAVVINEFGGTDKLQVIDVAKPTVKEGEVLVRIKAAGINPVDWKIRDGKLQGRVDHQFPIILGWDMAGVVEEVGFSARRFQTGDEVYAYCRRPIIQHGTYAEYITLPESYLTTKPNNISFEEAASIPLAVLTAYQSIYSAVQLQKDETILIIAASGGVGSFAVQLAKIAGAKVIALASEKNHAYLKELGADETLDYQDDFATKCENSVNVVFDCFGGDSLEKSYACLKQGGRMVSLRATQGNPEWVEKKKLAFHYVFVEPNVTQLAHVTALIESGQLRTHVSQTFAIDDVVKAHETSQALHTRGKMVLTVS